MLTLDTILFPTDDSAAANAARTVAERLAEQTGATLHVLRVELVSTSLLPSLSNVPAERPPAGPGRVVEATRRFPSVEHAVLEYAAEVNADLVVMGTSGRSGMRRALLGSVAEAVLRRSLCPVVTVGPGADAAADGPVLVPVAFESGSDTALETGAAFAAAWDRPLEALHVVEPLDFPVPYTLTVMPFDRTGDVEAAAETLERWAATYGSGSAPVTTHVVMGHVPTLVCALAQETGASLIVQASHGRRGPGRWLLGSVAEEVIRTAPCPVLTMRPDARPVTARDGQPVGVAVPRTEWRTFFDGVSARASEHAHTVSVDIVTPGSAATLYADVPLVGLTSDERSIAVVTESGGHPIERPFAVRSTVGTWEGDAGPWRIDVVRRDGTRERITVRRAEGPA